MVRHRPSHDGYRELRKRMIRETETYLGEAFARPGFGVRIPAIEVSRGSFTERYADGFWTEVLGVPYSPESGSDHLTPHRFGWAGPDRF